jgi:hypothetical protein
MSKTTPKSKTRLYRIYSAMKQRCYNENAQGYEYYGGKGITVCDEWLNDFDAFKELAKKNGYKENQPEKNGDKQTIDRINPSKGYCPENCRWISASENSARAVLSRDIEKWEKRTGIGQIKYTEQHKIMQRVQQIDKALKLLPHLSEIELSWLITTMERLIRCKEMGFDDSKYFEHGFKPYK